MIFTVIEHLMYLIALLYLSEALLLFIYLWIYSQIIELQYLNIYMIYNFPAVHYELIDYDIYCVRFFYPTKNTWQYLRPSILMDYKSFQS